MSGNTTVKNPKSDGSKGFAIIIAAIMAIFAVGVGFFVHVMRNDDGSIQFDWSVVNNAPSDLQVEYLSDTEKGSYIAFYYGNPDKTLDIYSDPRCPVCQELEKETSSKINSELFDGVSNVNVHLLTFLDSMTKSTYSKDAASVLIHLAEKGEARAAWNFYQTMWENQPKETTKKVPDLMYLKKVAQEVGASEETVLEIPDGDLKEFTNKATQSDEKNSQFLEKDYGKVATPILYLNDEIIPDPFDTTKWVGKDKTK